MKFLDNLFKPRQLPAWWLRFTAAYPALPNIIAITGLAWICFSLAPIISEPEKQGQGHLIETIKAVFGSESLADNANSLRAAYHSWFPVEIREWVSDLFGNIALYLVVPFLLVLEYLFPVDLPSRLSVRVSCKMLSGLWQVCRPKFLCWVQSINSFLTRTIATWDS